MSQFTSQLFLRSFSAQEIVAAGSEAQLYEVTHDFTYLSDKLGRKLTYIIFFVLGFAMYVSLPASGIDRISVWAILMVAFVGGFFSGFLGGGAGYIRMPCLIYLLGIPTHIAVGTDLFEIIISAGYGTYEGLIGGLQFRELNLFGSGRPLTASIEVSQRSYKGELLFEDPYLFDTDFDLKTRVGALTFDFDGYSKFEVGGRLELTKKFSKYYEASAVFSVRHVEITSADIRPKFLGQSSYLVDTLGFRQISVVR